MKQENIVLTGFMGCGKTTIGKLLATHLNYTFLDTDQLIEEKSNMTIPQIFNSKGEQAFRQMEREVAQDLSKKSKLVISTGGKLMLDPVNAEALSRSGKVFCLVATAEEVIQRISRDAAGKRPLLDSPDPYHKITELILERKEGYSQFTQLDTTGQTPEQVLQQLLQKITF